MWRNSDRAVTFEQRYDHLTLPRHTVGVSQTGRRNPGHVAMFPVESHVNLHGAFEQEGVDEKFLAAGWAGERSRRPTAHEPYVRRLQGWTKLLAELDPGLLDGLDPRFDIAHHHAPQTLTGADQFAATRYADVRSAAYDRDHNLRTAHATRPSGGERTLDCPEQVFELEAFGPDVHTLQTKELLAAGQ